MSYRTSSALGAGVFLTAIGAILYYAVTAEVARIDIDTVGVILMIAGVAVVLFGLLAAFTEGSRSSGTSTVERRTDDGTVVHETKRVR
jgi:hypothetical protein